MIDILTLVHIVYITNITYLKTQHLLFNILIIYAFQVSYSIFLKLILKIIIRFILNTFYQLKFFKSFLNRLEKAYKIYEDKFDK